MADSEAPSPASARSTADERMVEILQGRGPTRRQTRSRLSEDPDAESSDLLARLNALDFVDSVVGEAGDAPERVGEYRITGLLGRGGMGTVYAAFQESLERQVALKVLSPTFSADLTMRERFRVEARATASLHHEHIVPIYDFGEAGGVLFFAMERVEGVSLDKHIAAARRRGAPAMEPREAAARFAGVAEALHHAHRRRILHRDVKPGNLLVAPDGTLALADFGLSKMLGEASTRLTAGGAFLGTLAYAPPEQAKGEPLTPASDLYALGVTLFEAVTGRLPLDGDSTEAMLESLLHGRPLRLREVLPRAPKDLEAVLEKLLQKEPGDRYSDGDELARDLQRVAEGEPVRVRRQPLWVRAWRKAKKNRELTVALAAVTLLALLSAVLVVVNSRERLNSARVRHANALQTAVAAAPRQPGPARGPDGLLASLLGVELTAIPAEDEVLRQLEVAAALLPEDPAAELLRRAYVEDPLPEATAMLADGRGHRARQLLDAAIEASQPEFDARDEATLLRLYRLYVARAIASLTQSVADVEQAGLDLFAASFIRSGAFFPKLLRAVVQWSPGSGAEPLRTQIRELLKTAPPGGPEVAGMLLRAVAGLKRPPECELVRLDMPWAVRHALHEESQRLLRRGGASEPPAARAPWTGLEAEIATRARQAVASLGRRVELEPALELLQREVHPEAPLRSWRLVLGLLSEPTAARGGDVTAELPVALQIRGWTDLLRLDPPQPLLSIAADPVRGLLDRNPDARGAAELGALLARHTGTGSELTRAATSWYEADPGAPAALLCRLEGLVRTGDAAEAQFCAAELLQRSVERAWAIEAVIEVLRGAGARSDADWASMLARYEALREEV